MTIKREDIGLSYIAYDIKCPSCESEIFMVASEVKADDVKCNSCGETHQLEGVFENQISEYQYNQP
jgi:predicted Zn finger-like uncharacterized protein